METLIMSIVVVFLFGGMFIGAIIALDDAHKKDLELTRLVKEHLHKRQ